MSQKELQIHGSILQLLKKFIEQNYGNDIWLTATSQNTSEEYNAHENYSMSILVVILDRIVELTGMHRNNILDKFGTYLVPDLLAVYQPYINPAWKTFEMLENTEIVMHRAVRKLEQKANPPVLNISRVHDNLIIIDYYSERKMAALAAGIIKGIARFFNESEKVNVVLVTNPNDERVQIRVEFE